MPGKLAEQARQDERDDEDSDDPRHPGAQEVEGVIAPVIEQLQQVMFAAVGKQGPSLQPQ